MVENSSGGAPLYENLRKLISVVDELRDVGLQQYIRLPRIAVLGTQSSGKSSLLEMIVGIDFLPRGEGVVTRRPLELRLVHSPHLDVPYAIFEVKKDEKFTDFEKVRARIEQLTNEEAGGQKNIVDKEIVLTVYSPTAPDLTVIDLPGITRNPVGDQPKNIEEITRNMAERFVKDERTIILCVIAANADISTSDALQTAMRIDPKGDRTIGVITKIDIMDRGTNAKNMLTGKDIPLKLGYVGVKGRSQQDIHDKVKVKVALEAERQFFATNPTYSALPPGLTGTDALVTKLTKVLFQHIREYLPQIYKEIINKTKECEERLKDLGDALPSDTNGKTRLLWDKITQFTEHYKNFIRGKYDGRTSKLSKEISGGAKIKMMFHDLYKDFLKDKPTSIYEDKDIQRAIDLHQGDSIPGFPSIDSFLYLIHPLLKKLKEPAIELLNAVHMYLETMASELIDKIFERFPSIIDEITDCTFKVLRDEKENTRQIIENMIESEQCYVFTNDVEYMTKRTNIIPQANSGPNQQPQDPQKLFIKEMRDRIDSYFEIVVRNIRDSVPKVIGFFLVKAVQEKMQFALHTELNRSETIMSLLGEPPHITAERETLSKVLDVLRKAKKVLSKDPDLAIPLSKIHETEHDRGSDDSKNVQTKKPVQQQSGGGGGGLFSKMF
eukprot:CAMPEP_0176413694 /NCGR_PEP_ID=MMETSP0127-20121128/4845_1 /TAXON_ID=938130 /ORGANISM="Platyophrya macrostoma, Strain WH" /LENGTH=665 /DNA_ID=CAMNT_0017793511 /DNA_START=36 /DNA_END=2033 /DNA_ORIENTATION=-